MNKRILLASPRGFCDGVSRAIKMLDKAIKEEEGTIYVRKEIVHNTILVNHYKSLGVIFVNEVDEVPDGSVVVFSAHGVAPSVRKKAEEKRLKIIDTTCPRVIKIHKEAIRFREQGYSIILIGRKGHKEVIGITGEAPDNIQVIQEETDIDKLTGIDNEHVAWLSQTTLNVDDTQRIVERLHEKFPLIKNPPKEDICYATRNRQLAVKNMAKECNLFIVVGSANSSNTNRLAEVALTAGAAQILRIDGPEELEDVDFSSVATIGISSGVSVTENQLNNTIKFLKKMGYTQLEERVAVVEKRLPEK